MPPIAVRGVQAPAIRKRARRGLLSLALVATVVLLVVAGSLIVRVARTLEPGPLPAVAPIDVFATLFDLTPVPLTITADWQKVPIVAPAYLLISDQTLWLHMHFEDWNTIPAGLQHSGLTAMISRYEAVVTGGPPLWARMTAEDWDRVPQPIRAMAFVRMARYWSRRYDAGRDYGVSPTAIGDTLAAIIMVESWFEHRGAYSNADGTADLGLGGASAYCRERIRQLHDDGVFDIGPSDADYMNPWTATRAAALWLQTMLAEADGDVDVAISAYHTGISAAASERGREYAANVRRKRRRFIRNTDAPPAWTFLFTHMLSGQPRH